MDCGVKTPVSSSIKQKLNKCLSTKSELVGVDDMVEKILWKSLFLEEQGVDVEEKIVMQDNKSSIKLEEKGRASTRKRT